MSHPSRKSYKRSGKSHFRSSDANHQSNNNASQIDIVTRSVKRSGLSYESFVKLLIDSALSRLTIWSQADLERLLLVAENLNLDPLSKEIYAIETQSDSAKKSQIAIVLGVDGWSKIINAHPQFDGMRFVESEPGDDELPLYFECTIFRKDRKVATSVREYMYEAHTNQGAWLTHPRRMLRHKAMIQCARICFGLNGIYDADEVLGASTRAASSAASKMQNLNFSHAQNGGNHSSNKRFAQKDLGANFVKNWVKKFPQADVQSFTRDQNSQIVSDQNST